jgi:transcriptional regulator with XRE-family HTH domain
MKSYKLAVNQRGSVTVGAFVETMSQSVAVLPKRGRAKITKSESTDIDTVRLTNTLPPLQPGEQDMMSEEQCISAEAAEEFIESKRIGERIKFLRQRKQMGLVELGRHTGLSASFLSQLETGRVVPTLRNLARIAMVFSKDMSYFFEPERPELFRILKASERQRLPQTGVDEPGYFFESLGQVPAEQTITPYVAEFMESSETRTPKSHRHSGNEFLYILSGNLKLEHDTQVDTLCEGDAVFFNAEAVHSYERVGHEECAALILTMPEALRGVHSGSRIPMSFSNKNSSKMAEKR